MTTTAAPPLRGPSSRWLASYAQLSTLAGLIIGPLILWRWPGRNDPWVRRNAAQALDFQITMLLVAYADIAVAAATHVFSDGLSLVFFFLYPLWIVAVYVLSIRATIRTWRGQDPGYPPTVRLLRRRLPDVEP